MLRWQTCSKVFLMVILATSAACHGDERVVSANSSDAQGVEGQREAREVWLTHERTLERALGGQMYDENQLLSAMLFFERLTGIEIEAELSTLGPLLKESADHDFEQIRNWYTENYDLLYLDSSTGQVKVLRE